MSVFSKPYFHEEEAAFAFLEGWIWPNGPVCPHCGGTDRLTKVKANPEKRIRIGLHRCGDCKGQFTVKVGTVFEHARIPLHKMLQAAYLLCCSKKGVSAHQLHRILEVQYKTAWFLAHRIREAMRDGSLAPMGGVGKIVESDETFIGQKKGVPKRRGYAHKHAVLSLVERGGSVRSFHVDGAAAKDVVPILKANIAHETAIMTDEAGQYGKPSTMVANRRPYPWMNAVSVGTLTGELRNVVDANNERQIVILPPVGPVSVQCVFPESLRKKVKENLFNFVRVTGLLHYGNESPFPYLVELDDILSPTDSLSSRHFIDGRGLFRESNYPDQLVTL